MRAMHAEHVESAVTDEIVETCYMLKYVQMHEDPGPTINPWTIRQAALYQKVAVETLESQHIFVRLSTAMQEELQGALQRSPNKECEFIGRWESVHVLFLKTLNANWRKYINYLDEEVTKIVRIFIILESICLVANL